MLQFVDGTGDAKIPDDGQAGNGVRGSWNMVKTKTLTQRAAAALARRRRLFSLVVLSALGVVVLLGATQTALGAFQLNYFNVISNPSSVVLEWSTASEFNLEGFDVQCKLASDPDTGYHSIGFEKAKGGPNIPALYSFAVTEGVNPGVSYCFRLKELTVDGSAGEVVDRCGFGPGVTPTPGAPGALPTFAPTLLPTTSVMPGAVPTDAFGNPIPTPLPLAPIPPQPFTSPLAVPTDAFGNPLPPTPVGGAAQVSPLATPPPLATDAFGNPIPPPQAFGPNIDATAQAASVATSPTLPPTFDPLATALPDPLAQQGMPDEYATETGEEDGSLNAAADGEGSPAVDPSAGPETGGLVIKPAVEYVVVTATPTQASVALAPAAEFTPLPTITPISESMQIANSMEPTTQNLMVLLLCLTFFGASSIGVLGLITSVMFMRSRSGQREFYDQFSVKRRYW